MGRVEDLDDDDAPQVMPTPANQDAMVAKIQAQVAEKKAKQEEAKEARKVEKAAKRIAEGRGGDPPSSSSDDDDGDEEDKPYNKKNVKKMMKEMDRGIDEEFGKDFEKDEQGYKPITWDQLRQAFSYERVAHGFKLTGDISQKNREQWERGKQIKIRDSAGGEGAVFFYDQEAEPYFSWDDIEIGNAIAVRSPRYHRFLDGQEGMRLESNKSVTRVEKQRFGDAQRIDFGELNRKNGNVKFEKKKYDDAIELYETAVNHMQGTFHENPDDEQRAKESVASCFLNIGACHVAQKRWKVVEIPCRKALSINAGPKSNAKAYYRIGTAALELCEYARAKDALMKAIELAPGDAAISAAIDRLNAGLLDTHKAEQELFKMSRGQDARRWGLKRQLLSDIPTALSGAKNFRDVGGKMAGPAARLLRYTLYRSGTLAGVTENDVLDMTQVLGIKTIVDLRTWDEVKAGAKAAKAAAAQSEVDCLTVQGKKDGVKKRAYVDIHDKFTSLYVKHAAATAAAPQPEPVVTRSAQRPWSAATVAADDALYADRVIHHVDMGTRVVVSLASWLTLALVFVVYGTLSLFSVAFLRKAAKTMVERTALRVGIDEFYKATLAQHAPELKHIIGVVADPANHPVVLCCSLGKDRTGIVMALLLAAAGVSDADIAADYAVDVDDTTSLGLDRDWLIAKPQTILRLLEGVRLEHGSVAKYLNSIGVANETVERLRLALTVKPANATPAA
jgi:hypothetical protein